MAYVYEDDESQPRYQWADDKPASVKAGKTLNSIPREIGLTARYGIEGLANTAQLVTEPIRYLTDKFTPDRAPSLSQLVTGDRTPKSTPLGVQATKFADWAGLPSPEGSNERVVADATRLVAGAGGAGVLGGAISGLGGWVGRTGAALAANPVQQVASAAGAGLAGGASREAGGGPVQQAIAATVGGVGAGVGASGAGNLVQKAKSYLVSQPQMDAKIAITLQQSGVDYSQLPKNVQNQLRQDLSGAFRTGEDLNPDAVRRLLDFRTTGTTPTRGMLTLDPVQITKEQNLARIGANSADGELHGLPRIYNQNNTRLIGSLNGVGGASEVGPLRAGQFVVGSIAGRNAALNSAEQTAWEAAKSSPGYKQPIMPDGLNAMNQRLGEDALIGFLPKQITDYMGVFQTGQQPFTPQHYKNLRSLLSAELAKGGNEAAAARAGIQALDSVPITPIKNAGGIDFGNAPVTKALGDRLAAFDAQPNSAIDAINQARQATAAKYRYQESSPLVRSALSESRTADPEKIANSFVLNGTLNDARSVAQEVGPQGFPVIRDAIATHIKKQALSGSSDEVGKVSQSRLNKAIEDVGIEKLRLFFSQEEIAQLQATGRVASYMQVQPTGSAVNNSNSGALVVGKAYDALKNGIGMIPGVGPVTSGLLDLTLGNPTKSAGNWLAQRKAMDIQRALLLQQQQQAGQGILAPGMAIGGLLSAPNQ